METLAMDVLLKKQLELLFDLQLKKIAGEVAYLHTSLQDLTAEIQMLKKQISERSQGPPPKAAMQEQESLVQEPVPRVQCAKAIKDEYSPGNVPLDKIFNCRK